MIVLKLLSEHRQRQHDWMIHSGDPASQKESGADLVFYWWAQRGSKANMGYWGYAGVADLPVFSRELGRDRVGSSWLKLAEMWAKCGRKNSASEHPHMLIKTCRNIIQIPIEQVRVSVQRHRC